MNATAARAARAAPGPAARPAVQRLFAPLVPAAPAPRVADLLLAAAAGVAGALVFLFRQRGSALDSPWAEDGAVFLSGAWRDGTGSLLEPYAGYLHLFPRAVALLAAAVPIRDAAAVLAVAGVLPAALAAATAVVATAAWIRSTALRAVLGVFVVVLPFGAAEVAANVANAHWFFIASAAIALTWRTAWRPATWWTAVVVALAALSDPLTGLLLPLAVVRLLAGPVDRSRRRPWTPVVAPVAVLLAGLAVQAGPALGSFGATRSGRPAPAAAGLIREFVRHVPAVVVLGENHARSAGSGLRLVCVGIVLLAVVLVAVRRPAVLPAVTVGLFYTALYWMVPNVLRSTLQVQARGLSSFAANSRYSVIPILLLTTILLIGVDSLAGPGRGPVSPGSPRRPGSPAVTGVARHRAVVAAVLALAAAGWVLRVDIPGLGTGAARATSWDRGVVAATAQCRARPQVTDGTGGTDGTSGIVAIPISPRGWAARIPCSRLLR